MSFSVDPLWLLGFLLVFVRALAWLVVVPPFSNSATTPRPVLIGFAGGLALLSLHQVPASAIPTDTAGLIGALVMQVFSGVILGLPVQILLSAISSAGSMVDLFGGLNLPPSIDPLSAQQTPILGQLYEQVGMVLLFVTNGEMLGQRISGTGSGGQTVSGTVTAVLLNSSGPPQLTLAGQTGSVALDQVTQVTSASAAAAPTGTASTSTASTGATSTSTSPAANANGTTTSASG